MNESSAAEDSAGSSGLRAALALAALGVVLGDIGTSPLYALRECLAEPAAGASFRAEILGILSLILWTLIAVVSVKYAWLILKADNDGEGGILALTALVGKVTGLPAEGGPKITWLLVLGVGGMALFLADGMITPAISVLGALEGIEVAAPALHHITVPLTLGILVSLFAAQRVGTASIGVCFGPIILCWFVAMGLLGIRGIWGHPEVFAALNPLHGISYLWEHGGASFKVLGAVLLVATGAEALYADLGHFGARSIRIAWFGVALPCLVLNYFGQGALVLTNPPAAVNPFYLLAPPALVVPLIVLAAAATVIASQAVITGAFSMARQAVMLGLTPRLEIRHTSASHIETHEGDARNDGAPDGRGGPAAEGARQRPRSGSTVPARFLQGERHLRFHGGA